MLRKFLLISFFIFSKLGFCQTFLEKADTINKKRVIGSSVGIGTIWAGSMIGLSQVWYKNVPKAKFHTFNDCSSWLQMDKVGHTYTSNKISLLTGDLFKWSGIKPKKSALFGSLIGFGYQSTFEFFDAYSEDWGYSWCDMGANLLGSGIYLTQELVFEEQLIQMKFSYHPTDFAKERPEVLGSTFQERLFKDYNGQTYWLSFSPFNFTNADNLKWICFSFGYSVDSKLVGDEEVYQSTLHLDKTYISKREYLFSFDIDFSKINAKKTWCKVLLKNLNYLKVPFPALNIQNGKLIVSPFYF